MIEASSRSLHHWRIYTRSVLTLGGSAILYFLMFSALLGSQNLLLSVLYAIFFFLVFHFACIELSRFPLRYFLYLLVLCTSAWLFTFSGLTTLLICAVLVLHAGIFMLAYNLRDESKNKIHFSTRGYFNVGGYIYTVFLTIGYSLVLLSFYKQFPFTCEDLSRVSNQGIDIVAQPLKLGMQQADALKKYSDNFFSSKIKDVIDIKGLVGSAPIPNATDNPLVAMVNNYKKTFIDQAITDNHTVNMGVCDYVLKAINEKYSDPRFLSSVVVLLFLLLYSFIRIIFYVVSFIGLMVFQVALWSGLYHREKAMQEVDIIE